MRAVLEVFGAVEHSLNLPFGVPYRNGLAHHHSAAYHGIAFPECFCQILVVASRECEGGLVLRGVVCPEESRHPVPEVSRRAHVRHRILPQPARVPHVGHERDEGIVMEGLAESSARVVRIVQNIVVVVELS